MVTREYVPEAGDLIWIDFTPQAGREQAGRRPGLVLSPASYNSKTSLAIVCPVTSHVKGYPFEVELPRGAKLQGAVLSDHLKSLDWRQRHAERAGKAPETVLAQVRARLELLLGF